MTEAKGDTRGLTRRQAIERMAAGVAVAWTAPEILHTTAAFGAVASPAPCPECSKGCVNSSDFHVCGHDPRNIGFEDCGCRPLAAGGACFCHEDVDCTKARVCTSDGDCPSGYRCIVTDCCEAIAGKPSVCAPPCGTLPVYDVPV
jgi:hypothetical protein